MGEKNNRKMLQSEALVSSWNGFKLGGTQKYEFKVKEITSLGKCSRGKKKLRRGCK